MIQHLACTSPVLGGNQCHRTNARKSHHLRKPMRSVDLEFNISVLVISLMQHSIQFTYLHTEASTRRSWGNQMIQWISRCHILLKNATICVHVIVAAPKEAKILHDHLSAFWRISKWSSISEYLIFHSLSQGFDNNAGSL